MFRVLAAILIAVLLSYCGGTISESFRVFVRNTYGRSAEDMLAREDLGPVGSFGGGHLLVGSTVARTPVVFVHGVTQTAGDVTLLRTYFILRGYRDEEYYATTYSDPGRRTKFLVDPMKCDYVKQVRTMIIAVAAYTNSVVDVIGYSMGSPVARKAILGGRCVDTGEDLGPPLTGNVRTFLGIAGGNHGALFCLKDNYPECNAINGLGCGSMFLADINSRSHYEGQAVFSLLSTSDQVVGYEVCGQQTAVVPASDRIVTLSGLDHYGVLFFTGHVQYNLLNNLTVAAT